MNRNIISLDATIHTVSSYGLINNDLMNKKTRKYCHKSNTTFSPIGNSNNMIWSEDVKNYLNSPRIRKWLI